MKESKENGLIRASLFILFASGIFSLTNFIYHFVSARMLGPEEYGIVASLFSIVYLINIGSVTIQNTVTKFTANFMANNKSNLVAYLFKKSSKKLLTYSIILFALFILISPLIASFLKISMINVLVLSPIIIFAILSPINRGVLQGLQKFKILGWNTMFEGIIKVSLAIAFIYMGFKANGVIAASIISLVAAFFLTFPYLKFKKVNIKKIKFDSKEVYNFSIISFIALFIITAAYNIDIFLVKHFFSAEQAGHYAALSLLGKVIFFGATTIGIVMFPKIAEMHEKNAKNSKLILRKSSIFAVVISLIITTIYFFFSGEIIKLLFGASYLDISPMLWQFGIFMMFLSLTYISVLHKLAIGKKKFIWILTLAIVFQITLIMLYHNSLQQIINIMIILSIILWILMSR